MRRYTLTLALALLTTLPAPAAAHVVHTVEPGETLWSIAAASNFTTRALAAANGLPEDAQIVAGTTINIPSEAEAAAAIAGLAPGAGDAPDAAGAYLVQPGDTLSGIAARSGVATEEVAWMNGLRPDAHVLAGTVLKLPTGADPAQAQAASPPPPQPEVVPDAAPYATGGFVSAEQIAQIAADHGVPGDLAAALAWQESGFNNNVVSPANARGVMQILPGTWDWIQSNLASSPLDPSSPAENVHAGVMYLDQLLADSGGDPATALASYYQGAGSLASVGVLPDTQRYVDNVLALRSRFGG